MGFGAPFAGKALWRRREVLRWFQSFLPHLGLGSDANRSLGAAALVKPSVAGERGSLARRLWVCACAFPRWTEFCAICFLVRGARMGVSVEYCSFF